jgi:hypothetical protein
VKKKPAAVHLLKYEHQLQIALSPAQEITQSDWTELHRSQKQDKISNAQPHVKSLDKNSRKMMDASNPIGFRLFQDEPSAPERFYLQEWEDLTKRTACRNPKLALRVNFVV